MTVRRATPADAVLVGRMLREFNDEFETPGPTAEDFARRFTTLLERDDVVVLFADGDLGFAYLTLRPTPYYDGPLAQLEELYVVPEHRDRGLGTELMDTIIALMRSRDVGEIHINVDEVDTDTRRFYERHGFVNIEGGEDYRMLCYLREL